MTQSNPTPTPTSDPEEKSGDQISLGLAFQSVMMSQGACSTLLQWMAHQIGHDTEAGAALRDAGITIGSEDITPAARKSEKSATTSTSASKSSSSST